MKKIALWGILCLILVQSTYAQEWDSLLYKQIEKSIKHPIINGKEYNITKFGAKPEATAAANQEAIQKAINLCAKKGGGRVIVPAGMTFKTGAISMKSHVNLHIEDGAVLLFAFEPELYPIVETSGEGLECFDYHLASMLSKHMILQSLVKEPSMAVDPKKPGGHGQVLHAMAGKRA